MRRVRRDQVAVTAVSLLFMFAVGMATVVLPLLAVRSGYSLAVISLFASLSAIAQIFARAVSGIVLRRLPDRTLLAAAPVAHVASVGLVLPDVTGATLAGAWVLQGLARACFWSGAQSHVVRGPGSAMGPLAVLNVVASLGQLGGPVTGGLLLGVDPRAAVVATALVGAAALVAVLGVERLPPFETAPGGSRALLRAPGGAAACWSGATAGAWRGLMDGLVPAALQTARHSAGTVGAVVSVANAAAVVGSAAVARTTPTATGRVYAACTLSGGLGMAAFGVVTADPVAAAAALALAALGAGALQTLGPALASAAVGAGEQGDAIAVYGTVRAVAMFAAPLGVAVLVTSVALAPALLVTGALLSAPAAAGRSIGRSTS
jgi:hypothetical protein